MNEESNTTANPDVSANSSAAADTSSTKQSPFSSFSDAIDAARRNAEDKARAAAPRVKQACTDAAYDLAYGAAFGACFAAAFAREFVPAFAKEGFESVKEGLRKGFQNGTMAGQTKADEVKQAASDAVQGNDGQYSAAGA